MLVSFCHFTTTMTAAVSVSYFYLFIYFNGGRGKEFQYKWCSELCRNIWQTLALVKG